MGLNWSAISNIEDRDACRRQFDISVFSLIVNILVFVCTAFLYWLAWFPSYAVVYVFLPLTFLQLLLNIVIYKFNHPHAEARSLSAIHTFNSFVIFVLAIAGVITFQEAVKDLNYYSFLTARDILAISVPVLNYFQIYFFSFGCASVFNRSLFMRECYRLSALAPVATIIGTQEQPATTMVTVTMSQDMLDTIQSVAAADFKGKA